MKRIMFLIMFFMMASFASAVTYNVFTIPRCYGPADLLVNSDNDAPFNIVGWYKWDNNHWKYDGCDGGNHTIFLEVDNKTKDVFNFRIQYYVEPYLEGDNDNLTLTANEIENEANKRVENVNGFKIGPVPKPFKWDIPSGSELMIYIVVFGSIILIVIIAVVIGFKKLTKPTKEKKDVFGYSEKPSERPVENTSTENEPSDEDVEEFLKQLRGK